jgi:hypothetical protein
MDGNKARRRERDYLKVAITMPIIKASIRHIISLFISRYNPSSSCSRNNCMIG